MTRKLNTFGASLLVLKEWSLVERLDAQNILLLLLIGFLFCLTVWLTIANFVSTFVLTPALIPLTNLLFCFSGFYQNRQASDRYSHDYSGLETS
ncbi:MAG: hypothetical protein ACFB4I_08580 [Cyanophyceae cyanobacterium]